MEKNYLNIFVNSYKKRPLIIHSGAGSYLYARDGKKYLDFLSGISVNNLGYSNLAISEKIIGQLLKVIHPSNYYYTEVQINLATKLLKLSCLDRVFFANSGTEANEAALNFLLSYSKNTPKKNEIIVFEGSFFGRTYGSYLLANGGRFQNIKIITVPFNNLKMLKECLSESTLSIVLELVLGHGGIKKIEQSILQEVNRVSKEKDLVLMVDEVQTGLGRAGGIFLFQEYGITPDIVTLGKSLGGGLPLSAVMISERINYTIEIGSYGCTMGGNALACAAGEVVVDYLLDPNNRKQMKEKGKYIYKNLQDLTKKYPRRISGSRCYGLMAALEIRDGSAECIVYSCIKDGLLIDIVNKHTLRILPPYTVTYKEIDLAIKILKEALKKKYDA